MKKRKNVGSRSQVCEAGRSFRAYRHGLRSRHFAFIFVSVFRNTKKIKKIRKKVLTNKFTFDTIAKRSTKATIQTQKNKECDNSICFLKMFEKSS